MTTPWDALVNTNRIQARDLIALLQPLAAFDCELTMDDDGFGVQVTGALGRLRFRLGLVDGDDHAKSRLIAELCAGLPADAVARANLIKRVITMSVVQPDLWAPILEQVQIADSVFGLPEIDTKAPPHRSLFQHSYSGSGAVFNDH